VVVRCQLGRESGHSSGQKKVFDLAIAMSRVVNVVAQKLTGESGAINGLDWMTDGVRLVDGERLEASFSSGVTVEIAFI